ncbi:MAG: hypothetical protein P8P91_02820 [Pseudomonadales bacterium]|nr:hypothetical protein [Pseudomonadales bacterium]
MPKTLFVLVLGLLLWSPQYGVAAEGVDSKQRLFMFVSEPNAKAWRFLIDNPQDRQANASAAIAKLGGKILSYYFGLGNGRNYIIVSLPDDKTLIQAVYVTRLGDDFLNSYTVTELLTSSEMAEALSRVAEVKKVDDIK